MKLMTHTFLMYSLTWNVLIGFVYFIFYVYTILCSKKRYKRTFYNNQKLKFKYSDGYEKLFVM